MFIKPKEGKQIPHPGRGGFLAATGDTVDEHDVYWQRRIADEDVEITEPPAEEKTPKK
ncbi:MAG TPA: DUF2635 domain-containing protein [Methylophilaceae bacterium]|nr:DUF2635 domain-containing protein [Methylophilaceae bacterium]